MLGNGKGIVINGYTYLPSRPFSTFRSRTIASLILGIGCLRIFSQASHKTLQYLPQPDPVGNILPCIGRHRYQGTPAKCSVSRRKQLSVPVERLARNPQTCISVDRFRLRVISLLPNYSVNPFSLESMTNLSQEVLRTLYGHGGGTMRHKRYWRAPSVLARCGAP
jgi:hypothetical protein